MLYVFDLDMTLADNSLRVKKYLVDPEKKDYDGYYGHGVRDDKPIMPMMNLFEQLINGYDEVQVWTSRRETSFADTEWWFRQYIDIPGFELLRGDDMYTNNVFNIGFKMRPHPSRGTKLPDYELKKQWLALRKPDLVFDDRQRVVDMYRSHGVIVCQPSPGDF